MLLQPPLLLLETKFLLSFYNHPSYSLEKNCFLRFKLCYARLSIKVFNDHHNTLHKIKCNSIKILKQLSYFELGIDTGWSKIDPSYLLSKHGDLSFLLYFLKQCFVRSNQGKFQKIVLFLRKHLNSFLYALLDWRTKGRCHSREQEHFYKTVSSAVN